MEVQTIAVIGAGAMGRKLRTPRRWAGTGPCSRTSLRRCWRGRCGGSSSRWRKEWRAEKLESRARDLVLSLLATSGDVQDAIRDAELIIEAVPEELEMKLELFTIFDKFAKSGAIFASSTAALSITDFSDVTVSQERCIGMRFSTPAPEIRLIELIRTPLTSDETVAACCEVARRMGQEVMLVGETQKGTKAQ